MKTVVLNKKIFSWKKVKEKKPQRPNLRGLNLSIGSKGKVARVRLW